MVKVSARSAAAMASLPLLALIECWTATPIIDFYHDVKGTAPNTIPFVEGRKALALGLNFDYHNKWKVGLGYSNFFGGGNLNLMRDRDIASMTVSYTF